MNAAAAGHLAILQWARKNSCPWDSGEVVLVALEAGHSEIFFWCARNGARYDKHRCVPAAARMGLIEVLDHLLEESM